jgi:hypothetical protein
MLRASPMQKCTRGLLIASLVLMMVAGAGLATSAQAQTIVVGFNPTGGNPLNTNFGTLQVASFDETVGNAIAVGLNTTRAPVVGDTFTITYQATVGNLNGANSPPPVFTYGTSGNTGQLTAVATFTEVITGVSGQNLTFSTTGAGTVTLWHNPTSAANNLTGLNFAPGTSGNTLTDASFTQVLTGSVNSGGVGTFSVSTPAGQTDGALDQFLTNNYPGVTTVMGSGGTLFNASITSANANFFITPPPATLQFVLNNTSNNLPFNQADPSAIFWNNQTGVGSVGTNNGGVTAGGIPLAANTMFQADANTSFTAAAVAIPEPGTITAALTGIGFAFLASLRAARRRKTSAV